MKQVLAACKSIGLIGEGADLRGHARGSEQNTQLINQGIM